MTKQDRAIANRVYKTLGAAHDARMADYRDYERCQYRTERPGTIAQNVARRITDMVGTRLEHLRDVWY
jgi:hypothetical protein